MDRWKSLQFPDPKWLWSWWSKSTLNLSLQYRIDKRKYQDGSQAEQDHGRHGSDEDPSAVRRRCWTSVPFVVNIASAFLEEPRDEYPDWCIS